MNRQKIRHILLSTTLAMAFWHSTVDARAERLWIPVDRAERVTPLMLRSGTVRLPDAQALGEFLVPIIAIDQPDDNLESSATFVVDVPRRGEYRLWARLCSPSGQREAFDLVVETEGQSQVLGLWVNEPGGGRGWQWQPLREGQSISAQAGPVTTLQLPAGQWEFRLRAHRATATVYRPLRWKQAEPTFNPRVNWLCVTDELDYTPTDEDAQPASSIRPQAPAPLRVEEIALPTPMPSVPGRKQLPDWMRVPRWYTKDSWREELAHRRAGDIRQLVRQVAANGGQVLRLSCHWGGETYFQSNVAPHVPGLGDLDYLREALEEGARLGVKVVVYMNPNALYRSHPLFEACAVRDAEGRISNRVSYGGSLPDSYFACINHPRYRKFLRDLLKEMFTKYEPAGLYVDGLTPQVCFCEHCRRKFTDLFGVPMPVAKLAQLKASWSVWAEFGSDPQPLGDAENDVDARRWTEMFYRALGEVTREFSQTVKAAKPDAITAFHSHPKPNCLDAYDATLTEVYSPRPWIHTAWRAGELAGYSSAVAVPVLFNVYPHRHGTEREARRQALQGLAHGAYPNFWSTPGMKRVFDFMARHAADLDFATTAPVKFLALPRDVHAATTQSATPRGPGVDYRQDRFLAPCVGAYSALMRSGLPIVTLHRPRFEEQLEGFRILCLANVALMSDAQVAAVRQFVSAGGGLLATHETSLYDEKGRQREDFALADVLGVRYRKTLPAAAREIQFTNHPVAGRLAGDAKLPHSEPQVVADLTTGSAIGWLKEHKADRELTPAVVVHSFGKGRVVYLPGRLDAMQCAELNSATELLFANAANWLADGAVPVFVNAPGVIGVSLYHQPRCYLVHLLNHQRDSLDRTDDFQPIARPVISVRLPQGARASSVRALWSDTEPPYEQSGDLVTVRLPSLGEYELLALDWQ
ncbi:MAG: beta-galactosidase trimerization domain-containing protein [Verrucomicrobia bacterium]|nr:beta-galactosidase trimerization domain-containing protein [Verrucomicrobiota bacterium]